MVGCAEERQRRRLSPRNDGAVLHTHVLLEGRVPQWGSDVDTAATDYGTPCGVLSVQHTAWQRARAGHEEGQMPLLRQLE